MIDMRRRTAVPPRPRRPSGREGASPLPRRKSARPWNFALLRKLLWGTLISALVVASVAGVVWLDPKSRLDQMMNRPITGVSVESEFKYISQEATQQLVAKHLAHTFLELDMPGLKAALENNPWIDKVIIARAWPDKLVVRIQEQRPIARWGNSGFVNMRGDIIRVEQTKALGHLPLFDAEDHHAADVMQQYLRIKSAVAANNLTPSVIVLDKTLSWTVEFTPALTIKLGREQALEKLQNIAKLLRTDLAREVSRMHQIDMRYDNGFAVTWKDSLPDQVATTPPDNNPPSSPEE
jgi:cell division protein FtsQ